MRNLTPLLQFAAFASHRTDLDAVSELSTMPAIWIIATGPVSNLSQSLSITGLGRLETCLVLLTMFLDALQPFVNGCLISLLAKYGKFLTLAWLGSAKPGPINIAIIHRHIMPISYASDTIAVV
jgi:hypothetical protein